MVLRNPFFSSKSSKFGIVWTIWFCSNSTSMRYKHFFFFFVRRDFRLPMSALATVARKRFNYKFTAKIDFSDRAFQVTIAYADLGSLQSLHTLFDKYLNHMLVEFEQNRMVRTIQNCELFHTHKKMVNHVWQSGDAILEDVSVTETIVWCLTTNLNTRPITFQCYKNHCSPTRVTRLKVAPKINIADPSRLTENGL